PQNEAGQVELAFVFGRARAEEAFAAGVVVGEALLIVGADFVGALRDAGADDGDHARRFGAQRRHGLYGRVDDAAKGALPAGVGGADDACFGVGEQDGGAVGGQDGQHRTLYARDHGVAFGTLSAPAASGHAGDGGVDLIAAAQVIGGAAHPFGHAAAVLGDARRVVLGPHPGVQPGVDP